MLNKINAYIATHGVYEDYIDGDECGYVLVNYHEEDFKKLHEEISAKADISDLVIKDLLTEDGKQIDISPFAFNFADWYSANDKCFSLEGE